MDLPGMLSEHIEDVVYYLFYYGASFEVQVQPVDIYCYRYR